MSGGLGSPSRLPSPYNTAQQGSPFPRPLYSGLTPRAIDLRNTQYQPGITQTGQYMMRPRPVIPPTTPASPVLPPNPNDMFWVSPGGGQTDASAVGPTSPDTTDSSGYS